MGGGRDALRGGGGLVGYHPFQKEGATEQQITASILSIPDYVEKPLAAILTRALTADLETRFKSAGEFAGPLFGCALDQNLI